MPPAPHSHSHPPIHTHSHPPPSTRTHATVPGLVTETSVLDSDEGIRYRGLTLFDCKEQLPAAPGGSEMTPEGVFWLLLTGEVPTASQANALSREWAARADIPTHVTDMINAFPSTLHPMAQFSAAVTALHSESIFAQEYAAGMPKTKYWEATYEDSMNLIAKLPTIAAMIYRNVFKDGQMACIDPEKVSALPQLRFAGRARFLLDSLARSPCSSCLEPFFRVPLTTSLAHTHVPIGYCRTVIVRLLLQSLTPHSTLFLGPAAPFLPGLVVQLRQHARLW
jgi:hypothetical protein